MGGKDRGKQQLRDRQPRQVAEKQTDNWRESFPSRGFATGLCPPVPASLGVSPTTGGGGANDGFLVFRLAAADPAAPAGGAWRRRKQSSQLY